MTTTMQDGQEERNSRQERTTSLNGVIRLLTDRTRPFFQYWLILANVSQGNAGIL